MTHKNLYTNWGEWRRRTLKVGVANSAYFANPPNCAAIQTSSKCANLTHCRCSQQWNNAIWELQLASSEVIYLNCGRNVMRQKYLTFSSFVLFSIIDLLSSIISRYCLLKSEPQPELTMFTWLSEWLWPRGGCQCTEWHVPWHSHQRSCDTTTTTQWI